MDGLWRITSWLISLPVFPMRIRTIAYKALGLDIHRSARLASDVFVGSRNLSMKECTIINVGCFLDGSESISLHEYARVGPHVKILTGTHSYNHSVIRRGPGCVNINKPVVLERGVWIGMGAIIMPGVTIREGCIVGAGSVVLVSTEANGLYVGNPAKRIKDLPVAA